MLEYPTYDTGGVNMATGAFATCCFYETQPDTAVLANANVASPDPADR